MSRTHDEPCASCDGEEFPPPGGDVLRRAVAQRQDSDTSGLNGQLRLFPFSAIVMAVILAATAFYLSRSHSNMTAHVSDRLAILADGALLQVSMAVTRAESAHIEDAVTPALVNALAHRHLADGIYAYVTHANGQVATSIEPIGTPRSDGGAITRIHDDDYGEMHRLPDLVAHDSGNAVFEAETLAGQKTMTTVRPLPDPMGLLVVAIPAQRIHQAWLAESGIMIGLVLFALMAIVAFGLVLRAMSRSLNRNKTESRARRLRFETALTRARCGLWDWDIGRGRIIWSPSMSALVGLPAEERVLSLGQLEAMTHPTDRHFRQLAEEIVSGETDWIDRTFRLEHADGRWIWIRARAEIRGGGGSGNKTELIGIAMDITEQMRLAELSQTADQRLRDAIECVSEAFALWGPEGDLLLSNSKYAELAMLGRGDNDNGAGTTNELEAALAALEQPDREQGEATVVVAFPGDRWFRFNRQITRDGGRVAVGADITDLKNQEDRLREGERALLNTVAELQASRTTLQNRTQQLLELAQRYGREKTRAEMANRAKSDFLANMSHELRTPLNAILGFSEVMLSGVLGPIGNKQYEEYCVDIRDSGSYLLEIITDILDMSRIEAGRFTLNMEKVDLTDLVAECVDIMRLQAAEKSIETTIDIMPDLTLEGDRRAIKQLLLNLLSNSVKFTEEGGAIKVRARALRHSVRITIEDNGQGIPARALRKLGRPFEQVGDQHTRNHRGSGLGLAISRSLAELHHGHLAMKSRLGEGTTVSIRLPKSRPVEAAGVDAVHGPVELTPAEAPIAETASTAPKKKTAGRRTAAE